MVVRGMRMTAVGRGRWGRGGSSRNNIGKPHRRRQGREADLSMGHDAQTDADAAAVRSHRITSDLQSRLQTATNANGKTKTEIEKKMGREKEGGGGATPRPEAIFLCAWSSLLFIITVH